MIKETNRFNVMSRCESMSMYRHFDQLECHTDTTEIQFVICSITESRLNKLLPKQV